MQTLTIDMKSQSKKKKNSARSWWRFWQWRVWRDPRFYVPAGIVVILLIVLAMVGFIEAKKIYTAGMEVKAQATVLKAAAKDQNLAQLNDGLPVMQTKLDTLQKDIQFFGFTKNLPWIGAYYSDSEHAFGAAKEGIAGGEVLTKSLMPYAEVLGLKGKAESGTVKSTQDRIAELVLLAPTILPAIDEANGHFAQVVQQLDEIKASRYPETFRGVQVRQLIVQSKDGISLLQQGMQNAKPLIQVLPPALGVEKPKRYLILFQNDKELRPTGGFITSIAYVTFNQGKFTVSDTGDIYKIDTGKAYLPAPWPIISYLKVPQWNMRDTNFSPDFVQSMQDFEYYYKKNPKNLPIDGVIAVDTQFVEALMELTGPLSVPGYKEPFSANQITVNGTKIPQVVYQLELISEKVGGGTADRKGILGELMNAIIKKLMSAPPTDWPTYIRTAMKQGQEKHVLIYSHDADAQALAEQWNYAGRITNKAAPEDYLHINDANLAGLKSNLYLTQTTQQDVTIANDGSVKEKLTISYSNTGKQDGWLNARARNYVRVYVPEGSKLLKATGGEQRVRTTTDLGKTVFDNFVQVNPLQKVTVTFEYSLPFKVTGGYKELIQKQPGAQNWHYTVTVNGKAHDVLLDGDKAVGS